MTKYLAIFGLVFTSLTSQANSTRTIVTCKGQDQKPGFSLRVSESFDKDATLRARYTLMSEDGSQEMDLPTLEFKLGGSARTNYLKATTEYTTDQGVQDSVQNGIVGNFAHETMLRMSDVSGVRVNGLFIAKKVGNIELSMAQKNPYGRHSFIRLEVDGDKAQLSVSGLSSTQNPYSQYSNCVINW